jgi:uncharacterized protein (DUF58 family)
MERSFYRFLCFTDSLQQWLMRRFTPLGLGVLVCLGISAIIGMDTNQSLSYQVFTFLLALLSVAIAASLFIRYRFSATRILPRFGTVGVPLQYRVVLHNQTQKPQKGLKLLESFAVGFPSFQEFRHIAKLRNSWGARRKQWLRLVVQRRWAIAPFADLSILAAQESTEAIAQIIPLRRGLLRFKTLTIACPDPLGLFHACVTLPLPQSVLILPKRYQLPPIHLPGARRHQSGGVALATSVGDSEELRGLREYRPGDPTRKIHWKSWAKVGKPIVKEEQDEYFVRHALILDTFQPESYSEILEEAVAVAASLACQVQTQESLLDMVFVGLEAHCFTVGRGLGQTERMLELLASVVPCQDKSFDSIVPVIQTRFSLLSGCICILLTWDDARKALVEQLQRIGIPTMVLVIEGNRSAPTASQSRLWSAAHHPALDSLKNAQSSVHILRLGQIQQGLLNL